MTKTISLSDEAYALLSSVKRSGESFSDVATRLALRARQERLLELAGAWSTMSDDEADTLKRAIYRSRDESRRPPVVP